jgi:hypothetical protein
MPFTKAADVILAKELKRLICRWYGSVGACVDGIGYTRLTERTARAADRKVIKDARPQRRATCPRIARLLRLIVSGRTGVPDQHEIAELVRALTVNPVGHRDANLRRLDQRYRYFCLTSAARAAESSFFFVASTFG